jgi:hypothetical protein
MTRGTDEGAPVVQRAAVLRCRPASRYGLDDGSAYVNLEFVDELNHTQKRLS